MRTADGGLKSNPTPGSVTATAAPPRAAAVAFGAVTEDVLTGCTDLDAAAAVSLRGAAGS